MRSKDRVRILPLAFAGGLIRKSSGADRPHDYGSRHVFHSAGFWLGLLYVTFPLGLIIYGWNDIADADIDSFNPRKGTFLFGARGSETR